MAGAERDRVAEGLPRPLPTVEGMCGNGCRPILEALRTRAEHVVRERSSRNAPKAPAEAAPSDEAQAEADYIDSLIG